MHLADQRLCCVTAEMFEISWSINKERSHVEITTSIALGGFDSRRFSSERISG